MSGYLSSEAMWRGQFWLPGESGANDQQGILTYKPDDGVTLSLVKGFEDGTGSAARSESAERGRIPVIHGVAAGEPVTLLDCLITHSRKGMLAAHPHDQEVRAAQLLIGVLLDDVENQAFSALTIELENLTAWNARANITTTAESDPGSRNFRSWGITVEPGDACTVVVEDMTVELGQRYKFPLGDAQRHGLEVSVFAASYLTITSPQPKSLAEWDEIAKRFQDLLTFATDQPCAVLRESFAPSEVLRQDQGAQARSAVESYAQHINVGDPEGAAVVARKALFTLGTEGVSFDTLIPKWWEVRSRFDVVCIMILGLRYVSSRYLQTDVITAVGAAEALHEGLGFPPVMSKPELKKLRRALIEHAPEEHRKFVHERLLDNRRTLVTKLLDIAAVPYPDELAKLLPNPEAWAEATKAARNPIAHGGKRVSSDHELMNAIVKVTTAVIYLNLMQLLDIPEERVKFAVVDTRR